MSVVATITGIAKTADEALTVGKTILPLVENTVEQALDLIQGGIDLVGKYVDLGGSQEEADALMAKFRAQEKRLQEAVNNPLPVD